MQLQDLAGKWTLKRPAAGAPEELAASASLRSNVLTLVVEGFDGGALVIEATLDDDVLRGQFKLTRGTGGFGGKVDLAVRAEGRRLVGYPDTFADMERWAFERAGK